MAKLGSFSTLAKMYSSSVITSVNPAVSGLTVCRRAIILVPRKDEHEGRDATTRNRATHTSYIGHTLAKIDPGQANSHPLRRLVP